MARRIVVVFLFVVLIGCSQVSHDPVSMMPESASETRDAVLPSKIPIAQDIASEINDAAIGDGNKSESQSKIPAVPLDRKIVYTGTIDIVVQQFDGVQNKLWDLVRTHGGYIAKSDLGQMQGERRRGSWTVRVPADKYHDFLQGASSLGVPASLIEKADDVSMQFVDLDARLVSTRRLEEQILKLLEKQNDRIDNVMTVERELTRVRLDIERMEGQRRLLSDQVALSTIHITIREDLSYVPAQPDSLSNRVAGAWSGAVASFRQSSEAVLVFIVGYTFVIVGWTLALLIAYTILRRVTFPVHRKPTAS
jgi:hypothetical protein